MDDYYKQIEKYFSNKAKSIVDFSLVDREAVSCWNKHEIPLKLVLEGIDSAFLSVADSNKKDYGILSLYQCHRYVLESWFEQKIAKYRQSGRKQTKDLSDVDELNEYIDQITNIFNTARFKAEQIRNFRLIDLLDRNYKSLMSIKDIFIHSIGLDVEDFKLALWELEWDLEKHILDAVDKKEVQEIKDKMTSKLHLSLKDSELEENIEQFHKLLSLELRKIYKLYPLLDFSN